MWPVQFVFTVLQLRAHCGLWANWGPAVWSHLLQTYQDTHRSSRRLCQQYQVSLKNRYQVKSGIILKVKKTCSHPVCLSLKINELSTLLTYYLPIGFWTIACLPPVLTTPLLHCGTCGSWTPKCAPCMATQAGWRTLSMTPTRGSSSRQVLMETSLRGTPTGECVHYLKTVLQLEGERIHNWSLHFSKWYNRNQGSFSAISHNGELLCPGSVSISARFNVHYLMVSETM